MKKLQILCVITVFILVGCKPLHTDYSVNYKLSVENQTSEEIAFWTSLSLDTTETQSDGRGVIRVAGNSMQLMEGLELAGAPVDTPNVYARIASSIVFYDTNTGNVIREYFYGLSEVSIFDVSVDDADLIYYSVTDAQKSEPVHLFVPSDTRPFYLERDATDKSLARLIITGTPTP